MYVYVHTDREPYISTKEPDTSAPSAAADVCAILLIYRAFELML